MKIGEAHRKVRSASFLKISMIPLHCILRIITFIDVARDIGAPIYWRRGASVRQFIGSPMSPAPIIGNPHQAQCANNCFFVFGPPLLLAEGASVRQ
jgi:hypothetical protein